MVLPKQDRERAGVCRSPDWGCEMSWLPTLRGVTAALVAAGIGFGVAGGAVAADADVYVAVAKDDVKPYVIYIFSDSTSERLSPLGAMAYFPRPGYEPVDGKFNESEACLFTREYDLNIAPYEMAPKPIYGPHSGQASIDPFALPSYMAREGVKLLMAKGYLEDKKAAGPYFNCGGYVWAISLGRDPDEVKRLILEERERNR